MNDQERIQAFLQGAPHVVVGASRDRAKYGNMVLRAFLQTRRPVFAVNPRAEQVEGLPCFPDLSSLPEKVHGVSVITPPHITEAVVEEAGRLGIKNIWMQPGAESERSVDLAVELGMNVISGGPCILIALGYH